MSATLSFEEQIELIRALLARGDREADGLVILRRLYPRAPEAMLHTAAYHLWVEAPLAALQLAAETEVALRRGDTGVFGAQYEVLDHVYNWLQLEALLPEGHHGLLEDIRDARSSIESGNLEAALKTLDGLKQRLEGDLSLPMP